MQDVVMQVPTQPVVTKLRVIVRSDIPPGYMISQSMHAAIDYIFHHKPSNWWELSNTVVVLQVDGEAEILALEQVLIQNEVKYTLFREPSMGGQATSLALDPEDDRARTLTKRLPLALKNMS